MTEKTTKLVRNISGMALTIAHVGFVEADATIEVPADFHNANFEDATKATEKVEKKPSKKEEDTEPKE